MLCVCHVFLSVCCSFVVTCWESADLKALLCVMFYCDFVTFPCGVLGQVWCLIVSISDLCLLFYFYEFGLSCLIILKRYECRFSLYGAMDWSAVCDCGIS